MRWEQEKDLLRLGYTIRCEDVEVFVGDREIRDSEGTVSLTSFYPRQIIDTMIALARSSPRFAIERLTS